jgi:TatD DNase family protein
MIIDTHCHLDSLLKSPADFTYSQSVFLEHKLSPQFIAMSVSPDNWSVVLKLAYLYPNIHASLGIHPWYVTEQSCENLTLLESHLRSERIIGLGEIGLDFSMAYQENKTPQIEIFEAQLALATQFCKPISVHAVKAHNEIYQALRNHNLTGIIHGLGSSLQVAQNYVDCGMKIGINGVLLRENARRYHALVRHFGPQHLVLETDYPNVILPGLVNSNLHDIIRVAEQVAKLLNLSLEDVLKVTNHNAQEVFKLSDSQR